MSQGVDKEDTSPSFKFARFPKLQIFDEIFRTNLITELARDTNTAAGKQCKDLGLTLAIQAIDYPC